MCIILVGSITRAQHRQAETTNRDGFSLFNEELGLVKSPTHKQVEQSLNKFGIWHYRIGTSGQMDKSNIHPFRVCKGKYLLYHNGILGEGRDTLSDTAALAKTLYDAPLRTIRTVLESLKAGQRFLLVKATDPKQYELFGDWVVEGGVIMSHRLYPSLYNKEYKSYIGWHR